MGFFIYMGIFLLVGFVVYHLLLFFMGRFEFVQTLFHKMWSVGLVVHELAHYLMSKLFFIPTSFRAIHFNFKKGSGSVGLYYTREDPQGITFLKLFFSNLAPLFIGTWLAMTLWNEITDLHSWVAKGSVIFLLFSILLCFVPFSTDVHNILTIIGWRPGVFFKQIGFLFLSLCLYISFTSSFQWILPYVPYVYEVVIIVLLEGCLEGILMSVTWLVEFIKNPASKWSDKPRKNQGPYLLPFYDPMEIIE